MSDTVYISDSPNADMKKGSLFLFKLDSQTQPSIIKRNIGTVDYHKGEIMIDAINLISTSKTLQGQPIIELSVCPRSNDVIGLQDLYLQLDINSSTLNMLTDDISSGSNPSGTLYKSTSSYMNGNIARIAPGDGIDVTSLPWMPHGIIFLKYFKSVFTFKARPCIVTHLLVLTPIAQIFFGELLP